MSRIPRKHHERVISPEDEIDTKLTIRRIAKPAEFLLNKGTVRHLGEGLAEELSQLLLIFRKYEVLRWRETICWRQRNPIFAKPSSQIVSSYVLVGRCGKGLSGGQHGLVSWLNQRTLDGRM